VNYYEHHLGDYTQATAHLTMLEDAAYSRMLRWYYANEKPLPLDVKMIERLVRAQTKAEKEAIKTVLSEFFIEAEDGWHQDRADREIAKYKDKQAKAKRSAEARWNTSKTHSEGNANASADAMRTHKDAAIEMGKKVPGQRNPEKNNFSDGFASGSKNPNESTGDKMRTHSEGNAHQTPDTKHQTKSSASTAEPPPVQPKAAPSPPARVAPLVIELAVELRKVGVACTASHPRVVEWAGQGVTVQQALEAVQVARMRKPEGEPISANYLAPIIAEMRNPKPTPEPPWWNTPEATIAKGESLGIRAKPGEQMAEYRERIREAVKGQRAAA